MEIAVRQGDRDGHYIRIEVYSSHGHAFVYRYIIITQGKGNKTLKPTVSADYPHRIGPGFQKVLQEYAPVTAGYLQRYSYPVFFLPLATVLVFRLRWYVDVEAKRAGDLVEDHFRVGVAVLSFQPLLVGLAHRVKGVGPEFPPLIFRKLPLLEEEQIPLTPEYRGRDFTPLQEAFPIGQLTPEPGNTGQYAPAVELIFGSFQLLFGLLYLRLQIRYVHSYLFLLAFDSGSGVLDSPLAPAGVGKELAVEIFDDFFGSSSPPEGLVGGALGRLEAAHERNYLFLCVFIGVYPTGHGYHVSWLIHLLPHPPWPPLLFCGTLCSVSRTAWWKIL